MIMYMTGILVFISLCMIYIGVVFFIAYLDLRTRGEYNKFTIVTSNICLSVGCLILAMPMAAVAFVPIMLIVCGPAPMFMIFVWTFILAVFIAGISGLVSIRAQKEVKVSNAKFTAAFIKFYIGLFMCIVCVVPPLLFLVGKELCSVL